MKNYQFFALVALISGSLFGQPFDNNNIWPEQYNACLSKTEGASCPFGNWVGYKCKSYKGIYTLGETGKKVTDPLLCVPGWLSGV